MAAAHGSLSILIAMAGAISCNNCYVNYASCTAFAAQGPVTSVNTSNPSVSPDILWERMEFQKR